MKRRWQIVLPSLGLIIFSLITYHSFNQQLAKAQPGRYLWWSSVPLDRDPLERRRAEWDPCRDKADSCVGWDPISIRVLPATVPRLYMLSALPAFLAGMIIVFGLGALGVNQVWSFLIVLPLLTSCWYFLVGWLIDRRLSR
ncbi:MAG: hypothetical protein HYX28_10345 [Candidatus Koribacter versatilis]|uniref:Uncharacterized protein n=1 Tax=Candidatus Korobacter versatilis TaxID=658062 RepID=A0A932EQE2_9BACT|nr:hypothetical protein [Candidatus Koribacter versatilis]